MSDLLCLLCTSLSKRKRGLQCSLVDVVLGLALARQPQVSSWAVTFSLLQLGPALGGDLILVFVNIYINMYNIYTLRSANTRVRQDPGTRPVPNFFFKYPTRPDPKIENDWVLGN